LATTVHPAVDEAFAYCERLARSHYENFSVLSWFVPRGQRSHVASVYAFCRQTDDLGDEAAGDRLALLDDWEVDLRRCYGGQPEHPILIALQQTIRRFNMPAELFLRLIEANRMDQQQQVHPTYADLVHYCEHSANPVGHMYLYLAEMATPERLRLADATCTALQLTNFWQDIGVDAAKGRIYLPLEDMERFGYRREDLARGTVNPAFVSLMQFEMTRTRELFAVGLRLPNMLQGRLRQAVMLFSFGGMAILDAIEAAQYDVFTRRPSLSSWQKIQLMIKAWFMNPPD
jgi:squalene synthase HpnC